MCDQVLLIAGSEVVPDAACVAINCQRSPLQVVSLPDPRGVVVQVTGVACRREVDAPGCDSRVDTLGYNTVLKSRFAKVTNIVNNDIRTGLAKGLDVRRELCFSAVGRSEIEIRARSKVMDDLKQRRPFVARSGLTRQHRDPVRQIA